LVGNLVFLIFKTLAGIKSCRRRVFLCLNKIRVTKKREKEKIYAEVVVRKKLVPIPEEEESEYSYYSEEESVDESVTAPAFNSS